MNLNDQNFKQTFLTNVKSLDLPTIKSMVEQINSTDIIAVDDSIAAEVNRIYQNRMIEERIKRIEYFIGTDRH